MDTSPVKLFVHHHSLYPSSRFLHARCNSCKVEGPIYGGYRCNDYECDHVWFHKECAESPPEIDHPSHPDHLLRLTVYSAKTSQCDLCGTNPLDIGYHCSICNFNIDTRCARNLSFKPPQVAVEYPTSHDHPLVLVKEVKLTHPCEACKKTVDGKYPYGCVQCNVYFRVECVNLSTKVSHPCHLKHSLEFVASESLPLDAEKICVLCGEESENVLYHCFICNFSICLYCVRNPPPLSIEHFKTHKHKLTLFPRQISFTCNICGMQGDRSPYLCFQCGFMIHRSCIDLPRVININRHNHRISFTPPLRSKSFISFTPPLRSKSLECPICRQGINRYCGAYCSIIKNYAVHSHCATGDDVWDGIELEGIPEDIEDIAPFKEIGDGLIIHFLHEKHILRFEKENTILDKSTRCEACMSPVYSDPIYNCEQCDFTLHETCAKFPKKKRHMFHRRPFTLQGCNNEDSMKDWFQCYICGTMSSGFRYKSFDGWDMDVICSLFSEPFSHHDPLHPLYLSKSKKDGSTCVACGKVIEGRVLHSDDGVLVLDIRCANLPKKVKHICDKHFLSLSYGEDASGKYWCDICETEIDPSKWFYTCSDCGVTLHVDCVLGDFLHIKPGYVYEYEGCKFSVVPNNRSSRPLCNNCGSRCKVPFILKVCNPFTKYFCSLPCSVRHLPSFLM